MPQQFPKGANSLARATLAGAVALLVAAGWIGWWINQSPYLNSQGVPIDQPIPFSHQHHVSSDGLDCRYCHTSVEVSANAGMPDTQTCMTCHSHIWKDAPMLNPLRVSLASGRPLRWRRVYDLPQYVFFDHSIHVRGGVGCVTCHGRVDQMPITWRATRPHMSQCMECHQHPERYLRPRSEVFDMDYAPPRNQDEFGRRLMRNYRIDPKVLSNCSTCHH